MDSLEEWAPKRIEPNRRWTRSELTPMSIGFGGEVGLFDWQDLDKTLYGSLYASLIAKLLIGQVISVIFNVHVIQCHDVHWDLKPGLGAQLRCDKADVCHRPNHCRHSSLISLLEFIFWSSVHLLCRDFIRQDEISSAWRVFHLLRRDFISWDGISSSEMGFGLLRRDLVFWDGI